MNMIVKLLVLAISSVLFLAGTISLALSPTVNLVPSLVAMMFGATVLSLDMAYL